MKIGNIKNNVENKIMGVGVDDHVDPLKNRGITLIALIITIILMLILAGVGITLTLRRKWNI